MSGPGHSLRRRKHVREPKRRFIIFSEGRNTEPGYFGALRAACRALIEIKSKGGVGVPYTVAEAAVKEAKKLGVTKGSRRHRDSFEDKDEVWAVFDRDTHPHYYEAIDLCERNGVKVGRSNPCFELWLILHVEDYNKPDGSDGVTAHLCSLRGDCDRVRKTLNFSEIVAEVERAELRAKQQLAARQQEGRPMPFALYDRWKFDLRDSVSRRERPPNLAASEAGAEIEKRSTAPQPKKENPAGALGAPTGF